MAATTAPMSTNAASRPTSFTMSATVTPRLPTGLSTFDSDPASAAATADFWGNA